MKPRRTMLRIAYGAGRLNFMAEITTAVIKELRDQTGVSIMQCKKSLEESGGDIAKAKIILRKQSSAAAAKKSDRLLGAGIASAYTHAGGGHESSIQKQEGCGRGGNESRSWSYNK